MNPKKFLKKKYKQTAEQILQENRSFHDEMIEKVGEKEQTKKQKKKRTTVLRCAGAFVGVAAAVACVCVPIYSGISPAAPSTFPTYNGFVGIRKVSISDWTNGSKEFKFSLEEQNQIERCILNYDINTEDSLYYYLKASLDGDILMYFDIRLYPNPYYRDENIEIVEGITVELNGLTLVYAETTTIEEDIIYSYDTVGKIEQGDEMIFIRYSETSLDSQSGFVEFVQGFVQKK